MRLRWVAACMILAIINTQFIVERNTLILNPTMKLSGDDVNLSGMYDNVTLRSVAVADTYISDGYLDKNFGNEDIFIVGNSSRDMHESLFFFDFSDKPEEFWNATVVIYFEFEANETVEIMAYLTNETAWNETEVTWNDVHYNNGYGDEDHVDAFTVLDNMEYRLNVSEHVKWMDNFTLFLRTSDTETNHVTGYFREKDTYSDWFRKPRLEWVCEGYRYINVTSPSTGDELGAGYNDITWVSRYAGDQVRVKLYKNNEMVKVLAEYIENDGEYKWRIREDDDYQGDGYNIMVSDVSNEDLYGISASFSIDISNDGGFNDTASLTIGEYVTIISIGISVIGIISVVAIVYIKKRNSTKIPKRSNKSDLGDLSI